MTRHLLLTGATGLVGRYLLRDLLLDEAPLAVLTRAQGDLTAQERVGQILAHWENELGRSLPWPVCLEGDITQPGLGLSSSSAQWVAQHCGAVIHNAASLQFVGKERHLEPWLSNLTGTAHLLDFCRTARLRELHYISTAYVCGRREGSVLETELDQGQAFRNDYEQSKLEAEKLVRSANFLDSLTVYRPSVIVGDSQTGYTTTYHALYSYFYFVWLYTSNTDRDADGRAHLPVRVNLTGNERRNLVPVDWVSAAIAFLVLHPEHHGRTYHLTPPEPVTARELEDAMARYFNYYGTSFVGSGCLAEGERSQAEQMFYNFVEHYQPYWEKEPAFDCANTVAALPELPCPRLDTACLLRLLDFALRDQWGKRRKPTTGRRQKVSASG